MSNKWYDNLRPKHKDKATPIEIKSLADIPTDATPEESYRLEVSIQNFSKQTTKTGADCYFLNVRDSLGTSFAILLWDHQWRKYSSGLKTGQAMVNVHVPKEGFSAFTLG